MQFDRFDNTLVNYNFYHKDMSGKQKFKISDHCANLPNNYDYCGQYVLKSLYTWLAFCDCNLDINEIPCAR